VKQAGITMLRIRISLWGQLKLTLRSDSLELDLSEPYTTNHAIQGLADSFPLLRDLLLDEGQVRASILVFANSIQVSEGDDPVLIDGMELTLMSPIAGG
jgi:molybdopterin converting factor small subunit